MQPCCQWTHLHAVAIWWGLLFVKAQLRALIWQKVLRCILSWGTKPEVVMNPVQKEHLLGHAQQGPGSQGEAQGRKMESPILPPQAKPYHVSRNVFDGCMFAGTESEKFTERASLEMPRGGGQWGFVGAERVLLLPEGCMLRG